MGTRRLAVDVSDQSLGEECHPHHEAKLLDQDDLRFDVNVRIEIVKVQPHENAEHHEGNAGEPAIV